MEKTALQEKCALSLQTLLPWLRYYLRGLLNQAPADTLTLQEIRVLGRINRFPGLSLQGLADELGLNKATASSRVEQLVVAGLIERTTNPRSRREIMLNLSDAGRQKYLEAKGYLRGHLATQMDAFSVEELRQLETGLELLGRIVTQAHPEIAEKLTEL